MYDTISSVALQMHMLLSSRHHFHLSWSRDSCVWSCINNYWKCKSPNHQTKQTFGNVETLARNQAMFPDLYEEHIIVCHALTELHLLDLCNLMPVELTLLWLICILLVRSNHWIFGLLHLYQDVINIDRSYGKKHNRAWMC